MQMQSTYWLEKALKMISLYVSATIDTAELHRVYDNMLQRAQKCTDVQERSFSAPSLTSK